MSLSLYIERDVYVECLCLYCHYIVFNSIYKVIAHKMKKSLFCKFLYDCVTEPTLYSIQCFFGHFKYLYRTIMQLQLPINVNDTF